jgi:hypothetical protein
MNKIGLIFPSLFFILVVMNSFLGWDPYGMNFDLILKPPGPVDSLAMMIMVEIS